MVGVNGQATKIVPLITYPDDQGKWMHFIFYIKTATNSSSGDGIISMWHKWKGDASYALTQNVRDAQFVPPQNGPDGWQKGYLIGWTNPKYDVNIEWLLDDFKISTTSLLISLAPNPPSLLGIE